MNVRRVAVVIPVRNSGAWLADCLAALSSQTFSDFRTIVVDDASTDDVFLETTQRHDPVEVVRLPERGGFTGAANAGIAACSDSGEELIALLNVDTRVRPHWLQELVTFIDQRSEQVGALASKMLLMETPDYLDDAGNELSWWGSARKRGHAEPTGSFAQPTEVFSVCAGAALYRRSFLDRVGVFDSEFESYFEDIDLGLRGRLLGYDYWYVPSAEVLHFGHGSGLPRARYVELMTRNRAMTFLKNVPTSLLLRHAPTLVLGQFYFLIAYRRPLRSVLGYLSLARSFWHIRRQRSQMNHARVVAASGIEPMLTKTLGEPSLVTLLQRRLKPKSARRG